MSSNLEEVLTILKEWEKMQSAIDKSYNQYYKITNSPPDSPLWQPVHNISGAYTAAISKVVGDAEGWLDWYDQDNDMGRNELIVVLPSECESEGKSITVDSVEKLAFIICSYN